MGGKLNTLNIIVYTNFNILFIGVRHAFPQWQYANEFTKPEFSGVHSQTGYTPLKTNMTLENPHVQ